MGPLVCSGLSLSFRCLRSKRSCGEALDSACASTASGIEQGVYFSICALLIYIVSHSFSVGVNFVFAQRRVRAAGPRRRTVTQKRSSPFDADLDAKTTLAREAFARCRPDVESPSTSISRMRPGGVGAVPRNRAPCEDPRRGQGEERCRGRMPRLLWMSWGGSEG